MRARSEVRGTGARALWHGQAQPGAVGRRRGGFVAHPRCRGSGAARLVGAVDEEDGDEATTERTASKESGEESRRGSATRRRRGGADEASERRRCSGDGGVQRRGGDGAVVSAAAAGRSLRSNRGAGEGRCGSREREAWGSWGGEWGDLLLGLRVRGLWRGGWAGLTRPRPNWAEGEKGPLFPPFFCLLFYFFYFIFSFIKITTSI